MLEKRQTLEEKKFRLQQEELRLNLEAEMVKTTAKYDPVKKHTQKKSTVFRFPALKPLACFQIITSRSKLSRRSYLLQAWRRLHDFPRWHAFFPRF